MDIRARPIVSVTISAADAIVDREAEAIARTAWADVSRALGLPAAVPANRVIKEKRATFAQTPAEERRRPPAAHRVSEFIPGRRLDGYRPSGHHRRRRPLGIYRGESRRRPLGKPG